MHLKYLKLYFKVFWSMVYIFCYIKALLESEKIRQIEINEMSFENISFWKRLKIRTLT